MSVSHFLSWWNVCGGISENAWDGEYKYTVQSGARIVTPHTVSSSFNIPLNESSGSRGGDAEPGSFLGHPCGSAQVEGAAKGTKCLFLTFLVYRVLMERIRRKLPQESLPACRMLSVLKSFRDQDFAFVAFQHQVAFGRRCGWNVSCASGPTGRAWKSSSGLGTTRNTNISVGLSLD